MRLRDRAVVLATCSTVLALATILISHVIEERVYAPAYAGALTGLLLTYMVVKLGGGFVDLATLGSLASVVGSAAYTTVYYLAVGLQWETLGHYTAVEYLTMMVRSGVFLITFITSLVMSIAALLTVSALLAALFIGE